MGNSCMSVLIEKQAEKYGDRVALKYRDYAAGKWLSVSWRQFSEIVEKVAGSLVALGVNVQECIGVFSQNMPECLYMDFGAFKSRIVTVPLYATNSEAQVRYIIENSSIAYLFVGEQYQYDVAYRVLNLCSSLKQIVIFSPAVKRAQDDRKSIYFSEFLTIGDSANVREELQRRTSQTESSDLANILYTSGTTGESKGVMLLHSSYEAAFAAHDKRLVTLTDKDVVMNFLPFAHIFERAWSYYCLLRGCLLCINLHPQDIQQTIKEIRPTAMCSVPRFCEKVYAGAMDKIHQSNGVTRRLMLDALRTGKKYNIDYLSKGEEPPLWLQVKYKFYDRTIFSLLKRTIGIENGNFFPTAGAPVPKRVEEFVHSVGINMVVGYGLTETTATVSLGWMKDYRIGSVGHILPGLEIKFGENNEILLKGETVTKGYYKKESVTRQSFTDDGWFRTGDSGYMKDGFLYLTDRIKDLFKTSNGKYIAPQAIETKMVVDRYIDQISVIADQRKFVSALIVPEYTQVEKYASDHHIAYTDRKDLLKKPEILELFRERIETLQQEFAHYEQIKRFTLLPEPFSMSKGELTDTLKIRRSVLLKNYASEIERMYED